MVIALLVLVAVVAAIVAAGEVAEIRYHRRHPGPVVPSAGSTLPEPMVPSHAQRSSGNG